MFKQNILKVLYNKHKEQYDGQNSFGLNTLKHPYIVNDINNHRIKTIFFNYVNRKSLLSQMWFIQHFNNLILSNFVAWFLPVTIFNLFSQGDFILKLFPNTQTVGRNRSYSSPAAMTSRENGKID